MIEHEQAEQAVTRRQHERAIIRYCTPADKDGMVKRYVALGFRLDWCEPVPRHGRARLQLVFTPMGPEIANR
jgi:hypothetical protein